MIQRRPLIKWGTIDEYGDEAEYLSLFDFKQRTFFGDYRDDAGLGYGCIGLSVYPEIRVRPSKVHMVPDDIDGVLWFSNVQTDRPTEG